MFINAVLTGVGLAISIYILLVITRITTLINRGVQAFLDLTFTISMFFIGSISGTFSGLVTAVAGGIVFSTLLTITRWLRS